MKKAISNADGILIDISITVLPKALLLNLPVLLPFLFILTDNLHAVMQSTITRTKHNTASGAILSIALHRTAVMKEPPYLIVKDRSVFIVFSKPVFYFLVNSLHAPN